MTAITNMISMAGQWRGKNVLHDPETNQPEESESTLTWTPILDNRFFRVDYTWKYRGSPQEGMYLIGYEDGGRTISLHWIDTWHMGNQVMALNGSADEAGGFAALGSWGPADAPWGWRIAIRPGEGGSLRMEMTNITPDGQEYPAVEAVYRR